MTTMRASRVATALEWLATKTDSATLGREPVILLGRGRAIVELLLEELGVDAPMTTSREYVAAVEATAAEADPPDLIDGECFQVVLDNGVWIVDEIYHDLDSSGRTSFATLDEAREHIAVAKPGHDATYHGGEAGGSDLKQAPPEHRPPRVRPGEPVNTLSSLLPGPEAA
jgi:hypothetical protein